MSAPARSPAGAPREPLAMLTREERKALSDRRIKLGFVLFTTGLLVAISGLIFLLVTQIFDSLTPSLRRDLAWKALRGTTALSREVDLGLLTNSKEELELAVADYLTDPDLRAIVVLNAAGAVAYQRGGQGRDVQALFAGSPRTVHTRGDELVVWSESRFENILMGRVALVVSMDRVAAGDRLRQRILAVGAGGCLLALVAGLLFVSLYVGPILRITHATITRLEQTTAQALEATRLKSEFLANMSHEIRTPMNGVLGMTELLMRSSLEPRQLRFAEIIRASAHSLLTIVNDVLDFSKIEAGKYELAPTQFDVRLCVRDVAELLAPRAQGKGIELAYRVAAEVPQIVRADADRFRQILTNLLGNAVKFTERGEVILTVTAREHSATDVVLHCAIRDSGPGIAPESLSKLFTSFSQVDGSSTRQHGGTGLGLAISQRLARLMQGDIGVESKPGHGSTFWFTIRAGVVQASQDRTLSPVGRRALIVDDNPRCRALLEQQLSQWGLSYESFADATEAAIGIERALMEGTPFDVVLVEAKLEQGAGVELAKSIAKSTAATPVALLTEPESAAAPLRVPAELPVLVKPLRESELYDFLMDSFDLRDPRRQSSRAPRRRGMTAAAGGGHVLAVDDNEINQTVAVELLTELGYSAEVAVNGQDAVEKVKRGRYDAVLMDCQMPVMDGYQAAREIRRWEAAEGRPRTPIIALTAHALAGEREKVTAAGMDDFLTKPVLGAALDRALSRLGPPSPVEGAGPKQRVTQPTSPGKLKPAKRSADRAESGRLGSRAAGPGHPSLREGGEPLPSAGTGADRRAARGRHARGRGASPGARAQVERRLRERRRAAYGGAERSHPARRGQRRREPVAAARRGAPRVVRSHRRAGARGAERRARGGLA